MVDTNKSEAVLEQITFAGQQANKTILPLSLVIEAEHFLRHLQQSHFPLMR